MTFNSVVYSVYMWRTPPENILGGTAPDGYGGGGGVFREAYFKIPRQMLIYVCLDLYIENFQLFRRLWSDHMCNRYRHLFHSCMPPI